MIAASDLVVGRTYFSLGYEDERLTRLFIHSLEYLGLAEDSGLEHPAHLFLLIGHSSSEEAESEPAAEFLVKESELNLIFSFEGLAGELVRLAPTNGAWVYDDIDP